MLGTKMSVLVTYSRIITKRSFILTAKIAACIVALWFSWFLIATVAQCSPVSHYWNRSTGGECINEVNLIHGITATNLGTDLMIVTLPVQPIWKVQVSIWKRFQLIGLLSMGSLAPITAAVRIAFGSGIVSLDIVCKSLIMLVQI